MRNCLGAIAAIVMTFSLSFAEARPAEVARMLPNAEHVGEARYRLLAWTLFDAELWAEDGEFSWERPFALTLTYRRSFSARALANQTLKEMSRNGAGDASALAPLGERLRACFADVAPGDRITGFSSEPNTAGFFVNGVQRCVLEWPGIRRDLFGIWLDARGNAGRLSAQLRGEGG